VARGSYDLAVTHGVHTSRTDSGQAVTDHRKTLESGVYVALNLSREPNLDTLPLGEAHTHIWDIKGLETSFRQIKVNEAENTSSL